MLIQQVVVVANYWKMSKIAMMAESMNSRIFQKIIIYDKDRCSEDFVHRVGDWCLNVTGSQYVNSTHYVDILMTTTH